MRSLPFAALLALALAALSPAVGLAQTAIIMPGSLPPGEHVRPLGVEYHRVDVQITDVVAQVSVDTMFRNPYDRQIEGTFLFPLPETSAIHDFAMTVDGKRLEGEILTKDKARQVYDDIVRRLRDPGLLEYVGTNLFKASVFPIPARGTTQIELKYEQLLPRDAGLAEFVYPLKTQRPAAEPFQELTVRVTLDSAVPLKSIYSPTHDVDLRREGDRHAVLSFEERDAPPDRDFVLFYAVSPDDVGLNVLTHREGGEDGFFLLMLCPKEEFAATEVEQKDIVFVFDTSGSMSGKPIEQAREALIFCLQHLNPADRFNVVSFATEARPFVEDRLVPATPDKVDEAIGFCGNLKAVGGTNIADALSAALAQLHDSRGPAMIVFLTDGKPTVGETDAARIEALVRKLNTGEGERPRVRLFAFGVGNEVNVNLLTGLAGDNRGVPAFLRPGEDIEVTLSNFYTKVAYPVLSDLRLRVDGVRAYQLYPKELPDLFRGLELTVLGRYEGGGEAEITVTGTVGGQERSFGLATGLPVSQTANGFVPRLWAIRRVGYLLEEVKRSGESGELKDEIVQLALRYGIVTPYTSYLVNEDTEVIAGQPVEMQRGFAAAQRAHDTFDGRTLGGLGGTAWGMPGMMGAAGPGGPGMPGGMGPGMMGPGMGPVAGTGLAPDAMSADSGEAATTLAEGIQALEHNAQELRLRQAAVQQVGAETFYLNPETQTWVHSRFDGTTPIMDIQRDSEAFVQLIVSRPELARIFAQGDRVLYQGAHVAVRVGDTGKQTLSEAELREILE